MQPLTVADVDTPALLIDLDVMERNLRGMADYTRSHNLRLRPHTKTHKIPALARQQLDLGAVGLTVAKVGEAEVMETSGTPDLLLAYPVVGKGKLARLCDVARRTAVTVSVDSMEVAQGISDAAQAENVVIGVLAEFDAGLGRVGVRPDDVPALAKSLAALPGLKFEGLAFYPGHIKMAGEGGHADLEKLSRVVEKTVKATRDAGLPVRVVSGGSTPTMFQSHEVAEMNEIRPGTYIFNDRNTILSEACTLADCAASVLATVVSTAVDGQIIIDGGSKTFSSDRSNVEGHEGHGYLVEAPGAVFTKMNEEHGFVDVRHAERRFSVGDRVHMIPNHICVVMNLHERVYGVRGGRVESVWNVEARGKLQ